MILDAMDAWGLYFKGPIWDQALNFIKSATSATEEKKHILNGDDLFAIVVSYETFGREQAILETHRKYIDVHMPITGSEKLAWVPQHLCAVKTPYDESKDAEFYDTAIAPASEMIMRPGLFAAFYPNDAHTPQLMTKKSPEKIKKIVLKIALNAAG